MVIEKIICYSFRRTRFVFSNLCTQSRFRSFVTMSSIKIGTHDGVFHCDEALACYLLKLLPRYKDADIVRSRDDSILDTCDIVVDVGKIYDPSKHRYDHHMRTFNESISTVIKKPGYKSTIKLSSAGLIYCHFGHEIIKQLYPDLSDNETEKVFKKIYDTMIVEIDGIDNGIPMFDAEPLYRIVTDLSSRVQKLNAPWNKKDVDEEVQFKKAMELVGEEFMSIIKYTVETWLPARSIVQDGIEKRFEVDPSGEIIELSQFVPWSDHLYTLEKELNVEPPLKYIIFPGDVYRIRAVPVTYSSFVPRMPLPEPWAGLRDEQLVEACGIEGAVFVHAVMFTGGHKTREGALEMARKSLTLGKSI